MLRVELSPELGILNTDKGPTQNPTETVETLMDTHFPGNKKHKLPKRRTRKSKKVNINDPRAAFITRDLVKQSIKSFKPVKGCGPDCIPPIAYQKLGEKALDCLVAIYRASYLLGYVPDTWLRCRVVFIPKTGKKDYTDPRSFRPITLMNFIIKILEKVLLWQNEDKILRVAPLHPNQHGFRKGRSTESALTRLVGMIEHSFIHPKLGFTLAVFLDIQGAYDNLTNPAIKQALRQRGVDQLYIDWLIDFLEL